VPRRERKISFTSFGRDTTLGLAVAGGKSRAERSSSVKLDRKAHAALAFQPCWYFLPDCEH
jgi:hypothetical protein